MAVWGGLPVPAGRGEPGGHPTGGPGGPCGGVHPGPGLGVGQEQSGGQQ